MPIFEYVCQECQHEFETLISAGQGEVPQVSKRKVESAAQRFCRRREKLDGAASRTGGCGSCGDSSRSWRLLPRRYGLTGRSWAQNYALPPARQTFEHSSQCDRRYLCLLAKPAYDPLTPFKKFKEHRMDRAASPCLR